MLKSSVLFFEILMLVFLSFTIGHDLGVRQRSRPVQMRQNTGCPYLDGLGSGEPCPYLRARRSALRTI